MTALPSISSNAASVTLRHQENLAALSQAQQLGAGKDLIAAIKAHQQMAVREAGLGQAERDAQALKGERVIESAARASATTAQRQENNAQDVVDQTRTTIESLQNMRLFQRHMGA